MKWHPMAAALSAILVMAGGCLARAAARPEPSRAVMKVALNGDRSGRAVTLRDLGKAVAAVAATADSEDGPAHDGQGADGPSSAATPNLLGRTLVGMNGRDAGEVRNLLVDASGTVRAAVIEWGGFFGLGERTAIVPIDSIRPIPGESSQARLRLTREQLESLPSFDRDRLGGIARRQGWGDSWQLLR